MIDFWSDNDDEGQTFAPNVWDQAYLNDNPLPGIWKVTGIPTLAVDRKKAHDVDGAAITVNGYLPGPIELEGLIWTREQWEFFQAATPEIWRKPNRKAKLADLAITVSHPSLELWGISRCVVIDVQPPAPGPVPQSRIFKIKALEYVPLDTKASQTKTAKPVPKVPLDPHYQKNSGSEKPSATDTEPTGPKPDHRGGVS